MRAEGLSKDEKIILELKKNIPELFTDDKINWEMLKLVFNSKNNFYKERYNLNWAGKQKAIIEAQKPSSKTLIINKIDSINTDKTQNIFIQGENLEVLKILRKEYTDKIKMIYIDPPYNTGSDSFVYADNFYDTKAEYEKKVGDRDKMGKLTPMALLKNSQKENGHYHNNWLNMMYPRLLLAKSLLRKDGVIFVSIGEEEQANLKLILNEIFGEENFRNSIITRRYDKNLNRQFIKKGLKTLNVGFEYILCYTKSEAFSFYPVYRAASDNRKEKGYWKGFWNDADRPTMRYDIHGFTPETGQWKWSRIVAEKAIKNYEEYLGKYAQKESLEEYWRRTGKTKKFIRRNPKGVGKNRGVENWIAPSEGILRSSNWTDMLASKKEKVIEGLFDFPKNLEVIKEIVKCSTAGNDLILDFFAGSATTAHAVLEVNKKDKQNRNYICIQMPEKCDIKSNAYKAGYRTIAEIAKERIRRVSEALIKENKKVEIDLGFKVLELQDNA